MPWSDSDDDEWGGSVGVGGGMTPEELAAQNAAETYELLTRIENDLYGSAGQHEADDGGGLAAASAVGSDAAALAAPPDGWGGGDDPYAAYGLAPPQPPVHEEWARGLLFLRVAGTAAGASSAAAAVVEEEGDPHVEVDHEMDCGGFAVDDLAVIGRSFAAVALSLSDGTSEGCGGAGGGGDGDGDYNGGRARAPGGSIRGGGEAGVLQNAGHSHREERDEEEVFAQHGMLQEVFESSVEPATVVVEATGVGRRDASATSPPTSPVAAIEHEARGVILARVWGRCASELEAAGAVAS